MIYEVKLLFKILRIRIPYYSLVSMPVWPSLVGSPVTISILYSSNMTIHKKNICTS